MLKDSLAEKIRSGATAIGAYTNDADMIELMAHMGFDYVMIDQMFTSTDWSKVETLIRTSEASGITPLIRVQSNPWLGYDHRVAVDVARLLGIGAQYVIVSHSGIQEIQECIEASRDWHRKAMHIHPFDGFDQWSPRIDKMASGTTIIPQPETRQSLSESTQTLELPDVRMLFYAMTDASRVLAGDAKPDWYLPELWDLVDQGVAAARNKGAVVMANTSYAYTMEELANRVAKLHAHGVQMILVQGAPFLFQIAVGEFLSRVRSHVDA